MDEKPSGPFLVVGTSVLSKDSAFSSYLALPPLYKDSAFQAISTTNSWRAGKTAGKDTVQIVLVSQALPPPFSL